MPRSLDDLPRIPWRSEFAVDPVPHLVEGYQTFGPIFGLDVPDANPGMVFLVGPEANRLVLANVDAFWWGPVYRRVRQAWGPSLVTMDGAEHDHYRSLMQPTVIGPTLERNLGLISSVVADHLDRWEADGAVDVFEACRHLTFEVVARSFCGIDQPEALERFRVLYHRVMGVTTNPFVRATWDFDIEAAEEIRDMIRPIVQQARGESGVDALHVLANATDLDGAPLEDDRAVAQLFTLLLAGHDTTTTLSSWLLWLLAADEDVSARLRAEIDGMPEKTSVEVLRQADLLNRCLLEAERLYPPLPIVGRAVMRDVEFGGFELPEGTFIQLSPGASHRLPSVFADPDRFDPDRFAPPRQEHRKQRFGLIGFVAGARVCLGVTFAKIEVAELVVQVLRRFDTSVRSKERPAQHLGATASPGEPLIVDFTPRVLTPVGR